MFIERQGSHRRRGSLYHRQKMDKNSIKWSGNSIAIKARFVKSQQGKVHHDHIIFLDTEDLALLISAMGDAVSGTGGHMIGDQLKEQIPALVKLLGCAVGVLPPQ